MLDVDAGGRQQLYHPTLVTPHHAHAQQLGRSPSYYAGPGGCPHGPACPVHQPVVDGGAVWDGGHDCFPVGRRLEHVYESAVGGFSTRCRAPVTTTAVDESYLPPGQTHTDTPSGDQLFDIGRV